MRTIVFIAGFCSLLMVACQHSPQKNYYYLTAPLTTDKSAEKTVQSSSSDITQLFGIGPIEIAEYLNRSQIIDNQTDNTLNMANNAYWAEPLDKSIIRVIALNLTQLNSSRSFVNFPWRNDSKPRYSLRLRIDNLSRSANKANINATWELMDNDAKINLVRRNFTRNITVDSGAQALAQAYSQLLATLATEMDSELSKLNEEK